MQILKKCILIFNRFNIFLCEKISLIIYPLIFILFYEVVMRYLFNAPTIWVHELSAYLYSILFLIGGVYALIKDEHIKVDIFYSRIKKRNKAILDLFTWLFFYVFIIVLLRQSIEYAYISFLRKEVSFSVWAPPIWPLKFLIFLVAFLMLIQGVFKTINSLYLIFTGKELLSETEFPKRENTL